MAGERWTFSRPQLANTPSRKCGQSSDKELNWRQQAANLIQDMGQKLQVTQLCINTAIVFMHRFYMVQSFTKFHRNTMATACLFLAAKVEEQPRKLEHVLKASHGCLRRDQEPLDVRSNLYLELASDLVVNENILLQTLGFETTVEHPHTYVVRTCTLVRASKDLAQTSYFLATNSLHLTTMSLEYSPTVVACVCIHLACKWANWEIPKSSEGREWYWYVDKTVTLEILEALTQDFLAILDKCPSKLKKKLMNAKNLDADLFAHLGSGPGGGKSQSTPGRPQQKPGQKRPPAPSTVTSASASMSSSFSVTDQHKDSPSTDPAARRQHPSGDQQPPGHSQQTPGGAPNKPGQPQPQAPSNSSKSESNLRRVRTEPVLTPQVYFERKERERLERERIENERKQLAAEKETPQVYFERKERERVERERIENERKKLGAEKEKARLATDASGDKALEHRRDKPQEPRPHAPPGSQSRPAGGERDASKQHRQDQHRHHTNIFDEMREVRKTGDSYQSGRKSLEHGGKDRPRGEHVHSRPGDQPHSQSRPHPGEQRGTADKPQHHREGGPGHDRHPQTKRDPHIKQPEPKPKQITPLEQRIGALYTETRLPPTDTKPSLGTFKVLPPAVTVPDLPPLDISSSPASDGEFTSRVEQLIEHALQDKPVEEPSRSKSPMISVDDMDISDGDIDVKPSIKSPAKAHPRVQEVKDSKPISTKQDLDDSQAQAPVPLAMARVKADPVEPERSITLEAQPYTPDSERQSLKIRLDLKGTSSSSGRKHERSERRSSERSHHERNEKRRRHKHRRHHHHHDSKERRSKSKPGDGETTEGDSAPPREQLKLKVNLKNLTTSSPVAGASEIPAELEPGEIQDDDEEGEYKANQSPNPMKLVLSKSRTGHYSSREHKHRHSSSGSHHHRRSSSGERSRSRKRAHSPSESARSQSTSIPQKMPRSEQLRLNTSNHDGASNGGKSGSPAAGHRQGLPSTPSQVDLKEIDLKIRQVIELKAAQLTARGGTVDDDSSPTHQQQ